MAVNYDNLTAEKFSEMGYRETVQDVPVPLRSDETESLTKTQILSLIMIYDSSTRGYGQIRDYGGHTLAKGHYIPSESVPNSLDEKGFADVGDKKTVSRRTGRGPNGFEKKKEGGYVNCYSSDDLLDEIAQKFGFDNRFDDRLKEFTLELLKAHPNAR